MATVSRTVPRIGDVIEIITPKGLAYAQYTHKHETPSRYGALLRVFPTVHSKRPEDFSSVVLESPQFTTFFPLSSACRRKIVAIVANEPIPPVATDFPIFRDGVANKEGKTETWWLWDGVREWKVGKLIPSMEKYPIRGVINDTLLIERISNGWRHENDT